MNVPYSKQTIDSPNPIARYAHRNRLEKSVKLAKAYAGGGKVLDYGCGAGAFVVELQKRVSNPIVGYEPYMLERVNPSLPILSTQAEAETEGPFSLITIFEAIEHLTAAEIKAFLDFAERTLAPAGGVLMSGPIMYGPALLLKELNRCILFRRQPEHSLGELLAAAIFGRTPKRAKDIKASHKGFDFRATVERFQNDGWQVRFLQYGPLPIGTWYGNSQFYLWMTKT